jgi:hypothetical protein
MQTPNPYLLFIPKVQFTTVRASSVQFVSVGVESGVIVGSLSIYSRYI